MSRVLELLGCSPEPLMAYLKALGIFRLVSEQLLFEHKDAAARAWWQDDAFFLRSALDCDALVEFFLEKYRPTPIVSPWNNRFRTGVMGGDKQGLDIVLSSSETRFADYRCSIERSKALLRCVGFESRSIPGKGAEKTRIHSKCRALLSDNAVKWLDAVYVLTHNEPSYPPLTSNGGTLGTSSSGDIAMNFAKNLVTALGLGKRHRKGGPVAQDWLEASLFGSGSPELSKDAGGQFSPGGWGPNATVGFDADSLINPWDFVLMVEGMLLFGGAPARRLTPDSRSKAVFPFTVNASAAGYSTSSPSEYASTRAEFWAPLWDRASTLEELQQVVSEGRSQMGRRQASNGAGFARAIAGLGTERGISSFQRFGFLQRTGREAVFAASIGRLGVKIHPESNVLFDIDVWLNKLRQNASGRKAPAGIGTALRQVEDAIIEFCQRGGARDLQDVLIALGHAERSVSRSKIRESLGPLGNLSFDWLGHADDDSVEFRLAKAMSSILQEPSPKAGQDKVAVCPIRWNLEPVDRPQQRLEWAADSMSFVWTAVGPLANMLAVLERRCLEGRMEGLPEEDTPPLNAMYSARLSDVVAFLDESVDYQRVADLALPLSFIRYRRRREEEETRRQTPPGVPPDLPTAYAVMKLTLLPGKFKCPEFESDGEGIRIAMEPSMLAMLRSGRVNDAYRVAHRRLRASGLRPLSDEPGIRDRSGQGRRLAAALLFPLDESNHKALAVRALRRPARP